MAWRAATGWWQARPAQRQQAKARCQRRGPEIPARESASPRRKPKSGRLRPDPRASSLSERPVAPLVRLRRLPQEPPASPHAPLRSTRRASRRCRPSGPAWQLRARRTRPPWPGPHESGSQSAAPTVPCRSVPRSLEKAMAHPDARRAATGQPRPPPARRGTDSVGPARRLANRLDLPWGAAQPQAILPARRWTHEAVSAALDQRRPHPGRARAEPLPGRLSAPPRLVRALPPAPASARAPVAPRRRLLPREQAWRGPPAASPYRHHANILVRRGWPTSGRQRLRHHPPPEGWPAYPPALRPEIAQNPRCVRPAGRWLALRQARPWETAEP